MKSHRSGFFARSPREWNILDFIDYMLPRHPEYPDRQILGNWNITLGRIASCTSRISCCTAPCISKAINLLQKYRLRGRTSDRSIGADHIQSLRNPSSNVRVENHVNVDQLHVNHDNSVHTDSSAHITSTDNRVDNSVHTSLAGAQPASVDPDTIVPLVDSDVVNAFSTSYSNFVDGLKWQLPSGAIVEDVLYRAFLKRDLPESLSATISNWTIDVGSEHVKALFSDSDWMSIQEQVPPLPGANDKLARSLLRFSKVKTTAALRAVLQETSFLPPDTSYDHKQHFDLEWATRVLHQFLILYEHDHLRHGLREDWYTTNIWCDIIDKLFISLPHVFLQRTEVVCQSMVLRRNRNRMDTTSRMRSASRLDGIVLSDADDSHEFCAIEAAPRLRGGVTATKWLNDKAKLVKVLLDMRHRLVLESGNDARIAHRIQTVGISTAGMTMQVSRLCHGKGYVSLLSSESPRSVPQSVGQLRELLKFLAHFARMKDVLKDTIVAFRSRFQESTSDEDDELYQALVDDSSETDRHRLPPAPPRYSP